MIVNLGDKVARLGQVLDLRGPEAGDPLAGGGEKVATSGWGRPSEEGRRLRAGPVDQ
jgi:hypothetical protein